MLLRAAPAISGLPCAALCCSALLWTALCAALRCSALLWAALYCLGLAALRCSWLLWAAVGCFSLLWAAVGCSGLLFAALVWACLALSKPLQAILGPFRGHLGLSGPFLGPSRGHLGAIMGPLGAILALLEPSWSPLGAILGPLAQKHENDTKKGSSVSPNLIDFGDHFGVIFRSFSGSMFEPIFEQIMDPFWVDCWLIFSSKLAPKIDHFYKAFLEPSWSHLESRLGPPGALLRGLMFQKHCKNRVQMHVPKNASWPRVTSPGPPSRATLAPFWLLLNSKTEPKLQKKHAI